jgi:HEAT repeat protein
VALNQAIDDPEGAVRQTVMTAIGALHFPKAPEVLTEAARSDDVFRQAGAGVGLVLMLGVNEAVKLLAREALIATPSSRDRLLGLLAWLAGKPCTVDFCSTPERLSRNMLRSEDVELLPTLVADALVGPVAALATRNPPEGTALTQFLIKFDDTRSCADFCQIMENADARGRAEAVFGLNPNGNPRALSLLLAAIDDPVAEVRKNAACAISRLGAKAPRTALSRMLASNDDHVLLAATDLAGRLRDEKAVPQLARIAGRWTKFSEESAIEAMGFIATKQAGEALASLLRVKKGIALDNVMKGLLQCPICYSPTQVMRTLTGQRLRFKVLAKKQPSGDFGQWVEQTHLTLVCALLANLGTRESIHRLIALRSCYRPGLNDMEWDIRLPAESEHALHLLQKASIDGQEWATLVIRRFLHRHRGDQHFTVLCNGSVVRRGDWKLQFARPH